MRDIDELNITESRDLRLGNKSISKLEAKIGHKLPSPYINFISQYNGGFPELNFYSSKEGEWDVNNFFFIEDDNSSDDTDGVLWNYYHKPDGAKKSYLPIAQDGGGNLFFLDLDFGEESPVVFWTHDPPEFKPIIIASNFAEFVNKLDVNPDFI